MHILSVYCDTGEDQERNKKEIDGFAEISLNMHILFAVLSIPM